MEWLLAVAWMGTALIGAIVIGRALLLAEQIDRGEGGAPWPEECPGLTPPG